MSDLKSGCGCGCGSQVGDQQAESLELKMENKKTETKPEGKDDVNWYLPYMNDKTQGKQVEEKKSPVALFYCAGASNVGQSTVKGCVEAAANLGYSRVALLCLASISAGLKNMLNGAQNARGIVAIDGCPMSCAKRTLEKAELTVNQHVIVSKDLDIPKNFRLSDASAINKVTDVVIKAVQQVE